MKEFYGLRGLKLNIAIAVVAGTDFTLFGYGGFSQAWPRRGSNNEVDQGVMGGLLTLSSFLRHFPQVDTVNPPPGSSSSHAATIQAITGKCTTKSAVRSRLTRVCSGRIHSRLLFRRCSYHLARQHPGTQAHNFLWFCHYDYWRHSSSIILWTSTTHRWAMDHRFWKRHEHKHGTYMAV